ncbi:MAG: HAD family hydrolase [Planctomycetota bacterium]|jgi:Cof subfamily protein (haloacid dehalogenase superfamily)
MKSRLIALDLDGTLLPRSKALTARTRAAVRAVRDAGVQVVLATGKTFQLAARYTDELGLAGPVIALDGALVRDWPSGETHLARVLPAGAALEALASLDGLALSPFFADGGDRLVVHRELESWLWFLEVYSDRLHVSPRPASELSGDPFFVALLGPHAAVSEGRRRLGPFEENGLEVFTEAFSHRGFSLLVLRPRVDKGHALRHVASGLGVRREEVAAVGDWKNDVGMVEWAGTGLAMANADPEVLAVADIVLPGDSEADAVAAWLEELEV